jgi:hypothetical protein
LKLRPCQGEHCAESSYLCFDLERIVASSNSATADKTVPRNLSLCPSRVLYGNATLVGRISYRQRVLMKRDLYAEVSARIVVELEAGAAPWIKPWSATPGANTPCNAVINRPYSGCNDATSFCFG